MDVLQVCTGSIQCSYAKGHLSQDDFSERIEYNEIVETIRRPHLDFEASIIVPSQPMPHSRSINIYH